MGNLRNTDNEVAPKSSLIVLYDGFCPVCRRSAYIVGILDILNVIELKKYQEFPLEDLPVPLDRMSKRIQACNPNLKNCREGIFAFTSILIRVPPLFIPAVFTYLLGLSGFGQKFYDYISENRYSLPFSGISRLFIKNSRK